jgi:hypothetical protein
MCVRLLPSLPACHMRAYCTGMNMMCTEHIPIKNLVSLLNALSLSSFLSCCARLFGQCDCCLCNGLPHTCAGVVPSGSSCDVLSSHLLTEGLLW